MGLSREVQARGGVTVVPHLYRQGFTYDQVRQAVHTGVLIRPRRGWVALPNADRALIDAAAAGVVLSCITQAKRLGLWVLRCPRPHYASPTPHSKVRAGLGVIHRAKVPMPRPAGTVEDPIENVLWLVAACQPFEAALAIWDSALNRGLTSYQALDRLPLRSKARALLDASTPFSDSGLESIVRSRLRWLRIRIRPQASLLGHRVDFLLGERLVLQIDGSHHVGPQRSDDIRHDARLLAEGYYVIRMSYAQIIQDWPETQAIIMRAIARNLHERP